MKNRLANGTCIVLTAIASFCQFSIADDAPHWRGPNRDGKYAETGLLKTWPAEGVKPLWAAESLGEGYSSPSVSDGLIYCTGKTLDTQKGLLTALDLDGKQQWQIDYGPEWNDMQPGTRTCPTIESGRVYILSALGNLVCRDAKSGAALWEKDVAKTFGGTAPRCGFAESLLIDAKHVICTPGGQNAAIVALNKSTGEVVWTSKGLTEQSAYCSPLLIERGGTRMIVTILLKSVVAVDAKTGALIWQVPFDPNEEMQNHSVAPAYDNGLLYVTSGHRKGGIMFALSEDGHKIEQKWEDATLNTLTGGVMLVDGYVYGSTLKNHWACLRASDGAVQYDTNGVGSGSIILADGMFYCYGEKGTMGLAKVGPQGFELAGSFKNTVGKGPHWAHPVIANGRLYLRHGETLSAYDIREK